MTIVEISKAKIIKAIESEPLKTLKANSWIDIWRGNAANPRVDNKSCSVCAVGAVMRNALLSKGQRALAIEDAAIAAMGDDSANHDWERSLEKKNWMAALSAFFESADSEIRNALDDVFLEFQSSYYDDMELIIARELRARTASFVKDNFPDKIQVDIDGAKPAKDVKVVGPKKKKGKV